MMVFQDKLDFSKMNVNDGALITATVFNEIAEYQVPTGEIARFWGYTNPVTATQAILGKAIGTIENDASTPAEIDDNAIIRFVVKNASKTRTYEVFRTKYGDFKNGVELPYHEPGAQPFSYLAIEVTLPAGSSSFTFSKANSNIDVSTTVIEE